MNKINTAYIKTPALLTVISASIEVFHHETFGCLLGYQVKDGFIIEYAIPFQSARRGYTESEAQIERVERIINIVKSIDLGVKVIGKFHSHTQYGDKRATTNPSNEDLKTIEDIDLIIAVNYKKKAVKLHENKKKKTISGTFENYYVDVGGYYVPKPGWKYKKVKMKISSLKEK